jgi:hypothetical protein
MVGKCAKFAFALALVAALGFAIVHAHPHPLKISGSAGFSAPCEPPSAAFKATGESRAISTVAATFGAESTETLRGVVRASHVETVAATVSVPAPRTFPPLLHRPPPTNS